MYGPPLTEWVTRFPNAEIGVISLRAYTCPGHDADGFVSKVNFAGVFGCDDAGRLWCGRCAVRDKVPLIVFCPRPACRSPLPLVEVPEGSPLAPGARRVRIYEDDPGRGPRCREFHAAPCSCTRPARSRAKVHPPRDCARCGTEFVPTRSDAVLCSGRCRTAQHRRQHSNI